jgi:glutamyl-tRNA synthetase
MTAMTVIVRFAPSPTGLLHLGNARTAVVNRLFATRQGGRFVLRIDDTDRERSQEAFVGAIREDLRWLGIAWEEEVRQSERGALHADAFARLRESGRVYPAYETPEELTAMRARQQAKGLPPRYDRAALKLTEADRVRLEGAGRRPHWRFRLSDGQTAFADLVQGQKRIALAHLSDPVIRRDEGGFTYGFASVVDDLDLGITHVIRGEDHLTNTAVQIDLMQALGGTVPTFAHLPLLLDKAGAKLSKRLASLSLRELREQDVEPMAVTAVLATLGTGRTPDAAVTLEQLTAEFDLAAFGRAQPRLDPADIERLSREMLRSAPFSEVESRLPGMDAAFWEAIRGNVDGIADAEAWWKVVRLPLAPVIVDAAFCATAADLLGERDHAAWLEALKEATGRKGKALFQPLRLALTGREHGPPLEHLLALIGRDRAVRRLRGQTA